MLIACGDIEITPDTDPTGGGDSESEGSTAGSTDFLSPDPGGAPGGHEDESGPGGEDDDNDWEEDKGDPSEEEDWEDDDDEEWDDDDGGDQNEGDEDSKDPGSDDTNPEDLLAEADIVEVRGNLVYTLSKFSGVHVIDIANPSALQILGSHTIEGEPFEMYLQDNALIVMVQNEDVLTAEEHFRNASSLIQLDIRNPAQIVRTGYERVKGKILDSRRVGDFVYLVSHEDGSCWECDGEYRARIDSYKIIPAAGFQAVDSEAFGSEAVGRAEPSTYFSDKRMYISLLNQESKEGGLGTIATVNFADTSGDLSPGPELASEYQVLSRWQMNEHNGTFRVFSQRRGWDNPPVLETFDVSKDGEATPLARLEVVLPEPEDLKSARFDGDRAYLITFRRTDPLFTFDLSEPSAPKQMGELEIPGWVYHMEPRGNQILGLGYDNSNPDGRLNLSLFDVSDMANPKMTSRVHFGARWADFSEDQNRIHKSIKILEEQNLVLIPYVGRNQNWEDDDDGWDEESEWEESGTWEDDDDDDDDDDEWEDDDVGDSDDDGTATWDSNEDGTATWDSNEDGTATWDDDDDDGTRKKSRRIGVKGRKARMDCENEYLSAVQLIDWNGEQLTVRGEANVEGAARRSFLHNETLFALSDDALRSYDIGDRDNPIALSRADVALNAAALIPMGEYSLRVANEWWSRERRIELVHTAHADKLGVISSVQLGALAEETCVDGRNVDVMHIFTRGNVAYVIFRVDQWPWREYALGAIDFSDPLVPKVLNHAPLNFETSSPTSRLGRTQIRSRRYGSVGDRVVVATVRQVGSDEEEEEDWDDVSWEEKEDEAVVRATRNSTEFSIFKIGADATPTLEFTLERPDTRYAGGLIDAGAELASWHAYPSESDDTIQFYYDRFYIDAAGEFQHQAIAVPGVPLGFDSDSRTIFTLGFRVEDVEISPAECKRHPKYDAWDWQNSRCRLLMTEVHSLVLQADNSVNHTGVLDLAGPDLQLHDVFFHEKRLFGQASRGDDDASITRLIAGTGADGNLARAAFEDVDGFMQRLSGPQILVQTFKRELSVFDATDISNVERRIYDTPARWCAQSQSDGRELLCALGMYGVRRLAPKMP